MTVSFALNTSARSGAVMIAYPKPVVVCKKLESRMTRKTYASVIMNKSFLAKLPILMWHFDNHKKKSCRCKFF